MNFDKPVVFLEDIPDVVEGYNFDNILDAKYLGGVPNVTYRVIGPKEKLAVRICNHGYTSVDHLNTEIALLDHLNRQGFLNAPIPVKGNNGEYVQYWRGYRVFAMKLIDGIPGDRTELTEDLSYDVGRAIAQMQNALHLYAGKIPAGETYKERGMRLIKHLPETAKLMGWNIDTNKIIEQWVNANKVVNQFNTMLNFGVMHTDVWPPNILCEDNKVVGIVDFDDWAYGPLFVDFAASLVELPWFNSMEFNDDLAIALMKGFLVNGGLLSAQVHELLLVGMEMSCASWLSCNALHRIEFEESEIYLQKLKLLRSANDRKAFANRIELCLREASIGI